MRENALAQKTAAPAPALAAVPASSRAVSAARTGLQAQPEPVAGGLWERAGRVSERVSRLCKVRLPLPAGLRHRTDQHRGGELGGRPPCEPGVPATCSVVTPCHRGREPGESRVSVCREGGDLQTSDSCPLTASRVPSWGALPPHLGFPRSPIPWVMSWILLLSQMETVTRYHRPAHKLLFQKAGPLQTRGWEGSRPHPLRPQRQGSSCRSQVWPRPPPMNTQQLTSPLCLAVRIFSLLPDSCLWFRRTSGSRT